uniref:Ankyrin repeat and SAM domain-containing protein 6 n=1 Tax=Bactrocera dorsalis TaxID=27457 RepID=A0A034VW98_BACDO
MDFEDPASPIIPFTPITIRDCSFDFDGANSDADPDDNTTLTPLLRRLNTVQNILTPKSLLRAAAKSPARTPTVINGRLAPPQLQQHYSKSPQRRGSPLVGFRRLRSPHTSNDLGALSTRLEVPTQHNLAAANGGCCAKNNSTVKNLATRRHCRPLGLKDLQRRYAKPFEVYAVPKPLSPRVGYLLRRVGMIKYKSIFQMEEVDYVVFCTLSEGDLQQLGISNADDRGEIYKAVLLADVLIRDWL